MIRHVVLVTGGRDYDDEAAVERFVATLPPGTLVINGLARGADKLVRAKARKRGNPTADVPFFEWLGKRGGFERNQVMVDMAALFRDAGCLVKAVAFPGGTGTEDCKERIEAAGLPLQEVS